MTTRISAVPIPGPIPGPIPEVPISLELAVLHAHSAPAVPATNGGASS